MSEQKRRVNETDAEVKGLGCFYHHEQRGKIVKGNGANTMAPTAQRTLNDGVLCVLYAQL